MTDYLAPAKPGELGMLFSFHYYGKVDMTEWVSRQPYRPTIFVDSGGFSAFTQGVDVDIHAYASWIRCNSGVFSHYANLDVVGSAAGTLGNQLKMERMGLRPLPITHFGSNPKHIATYAKHGYEYQCLGGMVPQMRGVAQAIAGKRSHPLLDWLDQCFAVATEHGVRFHGFGATTWSILCRYPWRSVDSSTWSSGYRFGSIMLFDLKRFKWVNMPLRSAKKIMPYAGQIRGYGADPVSLVKDDPSSRMNIIKLSARSWLAAQRHLNKQGLSQGLSHIFLADASGEAIDAERAIQTIARDTRVFLVDAAVTHLETATEALKE